LLYLAPAIALCAPSARERHRARELYEKSEVSYRSGRFAEAAQLLREAYRLDPNPTLLYNLARALESTGDLAGAEDAYTRFLAGNVEPADRKVAEARLTVVRRLLADRKHLEEAARARPPPEPAVESAPPAPPEPQPKEAEEAEAPPPRARSKIPYIVGGAGLAALATGGVLGYIARSTENDAKSAPTHAQLVTLDAKARRYNTGANVAFVAGGIAAAAGVGWAIWDWRRVAHERERVSLRWSVSPASVAVSVTIP
jgi:tetratricopeptide (TPR) repeat protein